MDDPRPLTPQGLTTCLGILEILGGLNVVCFRKYMNICDMLNWQKNKPLNYVEGSFMSANKSL